MEIAGVASEQVFVDFVNSEWYDGQGHLEERLIDPRWRAEFLQVWAFGEPGNPSRAVLQRLSRLRDVLRAIVEEAHAGHARSGLRLRGLASTLPPVSMRLRVSGKPSTPSWVAESPSWAYVEAEVIGSCLEFLAGPAALRLRRCRNDGCRWAFVDASRNGCRRWCDPAICGNVSKVRAHRARQRNLARQGAATASKPKAARG